MFTNTMKPISSMPDDRKDGRLMLVSGGKARWFARWLPGLTPETGRFRCYDGGAIDVDLPTILFWDDELEGVNAAGAI